MALTDDDGWTAGYLAACVSLRTATPERLRDVLKSARRHESSPSADDAETWALDSDRYDRSWSAFGWYQGVAVAWEDNGNAGTDPTTRAKPAEVGSRACSGT